MKLSEARILIFLDSVPGNLRYCAKISSKLGTDLAYTNQVLQQMAEKRWIDFSKSQNKKMYSLRMNTAPLKEAKEIITEEKSK